MNSTRKNLLKAGILTALFAVFALIPALTNGVKADGTPVILVRTATLTSPTGGVNPHGAAVWQLYQSGNRELEVEADDVNLAQGTNLSMYIDGDLVGQAPVDSRRRARLKLRTESGQAVPVVNAGSTAEVRNGTAVLVSGVFGGQTPTPTGSGTVTPSPSGTGTVTPSPSETETETPTPSGTGTVTPSPSETETPSPSGTGTSTPSPSPTGNPNELFAGLSGPTLNGVLPTGFAEFEVEVGHTELDVRVRQVNLAIGTQLAVTVDGSIVGNMTLQSGGEGRLQLRSDNGQSVPPIVPGSTISINNGNSSVLSGMFGAFVTPGPSGTSTATETPTSTPTPFGRSFEAHLSGSQITPPVVTDANGEIKVTLNAGETQATVFGEFHLLSSDQTGARIETTVGTPVTIVDLGVVGGQNGHFAAVSFNVSTTQVQQLRAGLWSAVITSVNNANGEIRGQFRNRSRHSDFDGDGQHDMAIFRPSSGTWYSQNTNGFSALPFGLSGDRVVSADYDGDGKTDAAVFHNHNGQGLWRIKRSADGGVTNVSWGIATDTPVRGDFDGDGRVDIAVYRASEGVWYIKQSNNTGTRIEHFGIAEDMPVPADMDGDGRDDIVVFRPALGNWYWLQSSDGKFVATHFGVAGDLPVTGDFDGDGKADVTVYRRSAGVWYTQVSPTGRFRAVHFGLSDDIPVAGNYDGDGKTDIAVFRPSDGNWYILRSSDGTFQAAHFGSAGDIPAIAR